MLISVGDLVKPGTYRFHSRFDRAVNFVHEGRLIAVVQESIGPGPFNIVLRSLPEGAQPSGCRSPGSLGGIRRIPEPSTLLQPEGCAPMGQAMPALQEAPPLRVSPATVLFDGHRYPFTSGHRYNSTLDLQPVDLPRFQHNLSVLGTSLKADSPPKSLAFLLDGKRRKNFRPGFERAFAQQITRGVHQVFHGPLLPGIRQLKGCGLGLTPAGDDFIAGYLIGLHLLRTLRGQDSRPTADAVFRAARGKNIFSNTFLDLARRGLLSGYLKDLLVALVSGSEASVLKATSKLFTVGETSGADLATGLFMTLQSSL
jgi:hypothetical protein